jgi:hypothetical protein
MTTALTTSNNLTFTSTGLEVPDNYLPTAEEWLQAGLSFRQFVSTIDAAVAFCYGDWLNLGEQVLGEDYAQGFEVVLPINPDDFQLQRAEKTIYQYRSLARETPRWMRGLPGLSARHYLNAIRIPDLVARYEHLVQASVQGWSVRRAAQELPNGELPQLPATKDDLNHQLTVENHHLQHELDVNRAMIEEASGNIGEARSILEHVVDELPTEQAEQVQKALSYLKPVIRSEFVELVDVAIDLYDRGEIGAMVEVMERLKVLRREMTCIELSARADCASCPVGDDIITVNGKIEHRGEWLENGV